MILTNLENIQRYLGIHPNLDIAIEYMKNNNLSKLPLGKTEINDDVFVNRFEYFADGKINDFFEGHQKYLDIHIVLRGTEVMTVLDVAKAQMTKSYENDCAFFAGEAEVVCTLNSSDCLIVFPEDLHQPKIEYDKNIVEKIVFKVKIS